jgi:hypothetical protein
MRTEKANDRTIRRRVVMALLPLTVCLSLGCTDSHFFDRDRDDRPDPLTGLDRTRPDRRNVSVTANGDGRTPASLAGTSGLGMRDTNSSSAATSRDVQTTGWTGTRSDDPSAAPKLGTPTAGGPTGARSSPTAAGGTGRIRTFEEAQQILIARGVKAQELRQTDGEWNFSCSVTLGANRMKTYEASDRYGLLAIQKVIDKMNQDGR